MIEVSGGRAGPHEPGWIMAGYQREEIEPLRQQLLSQNDYFQVQTAMQKLGIHIKRKMLRQVKRYMFDSYGIGFLYENYMTWRRLATRKGLLGDASYLIHEITEVKELLPLTRLVNRKLGNVCWYQGFRCKNIILLRCGVRELTIPCPLIR